MGTELLVITLAISWQAAVKWWDIKEAIIRALRRMLYFSQSVLSAWAPITCAFVLPFSLLDAVMNTGWLSEVWVTCSLSQGWTQWPCAGKRQTFEQEAHSGNGCCIVARRLKPGLQSVGNFTVKFHWYIRVSAGRVTFYCFFSYVQWLLVLRLFQTFVCVCPAPTSNLNKQTDRRIVQSQWLKS